jgi:chemotaxis signal transduction protein
VKRISAGKKTVHRGEPAILFGVGDYTFAIGAMAVDEIRNTDGLQQIGLTGDMRVPKVKYRLMRDGRNYYVVDAAQYFRMLPAHATRVLLLRNSHTAVLVGHIDRMAEIGNVLALPHAFRGEEQTWYRGLTVLDASGDTPVVVPVVRPEEFLSGDELKLIEAGEPRKEVKAAPRSRS